MMPRARRIGALAQRDWLIEFKGRTGWLMPGVLASLLLPAALVPAGGAPAVDLPAEQVFVTGDVPAEVASYPGVIVKPALPADANFIAVTPGVVDVELLRMRPLLRRALDGDSPQVTLKRNEHVWLFPGRGLLFGLVAASTLTGTVSQSLAGERHKRTLLALLAAAVTRLEVVLGKWLAWSAFGGVAALGAALGALLAGTVTAGPWLVPLLTVPAATVALGLWLVRDAGDVVTGATISLRVIPAVLSVLGLIAWWIGQDHPLLAAIVPLGGALVSSGGMFGGAWLPALLSAVTSLTMSALLLADTARALDREPVASAGEGVSPLRALGPAALAAAVWWICVGGAGLLYAGGNPTRANELPLADGLLAGAASLIAITLMYLATNRQPGSRAPANVPATIPAALLGGGLLGLASANGWLASAPLAPHALFTFNRFSAGLAPTLEVLLAGAVALIAQEALLRRVIQPRAGAIAAVLSFAVIVTPHAPIAGLLVGSLTAGVTRLGGGALWPALLARAALVLAALAVAD